MLNVWEEGPTGRIKRSTNKVLLWDGMVLRAQKTQQEEGEL